jgi:tetratricopeptide (TPR) repeat protein
MGVVFRAHDPHLDRFVAVKALLPSYAASTSAHERFVREARAAAQFAHDHVVPIYQVGEDRGVPFLAMQLLEGESLERRLQHQRVLPAAEIMRIGREAAEGLAAAHARGLVHRDIKPANLWLERDRGRLKLLDFGLAQAARAEMRLTQPGAVVGTPGFMAPEQAAGQPLDGRCDLFSLGCVLYLAATGQRPFQGPDVISALVAAATEHPPPPAELNPALPPALSDLIMALLAKDPKDRPASAGAVVDAIRAIEGDVTEELPSNLPAADRKAQAAQGKAAPKGPVWRRGWFLGAGAALVLGAAAVIAVLRFSGLEENPGLDQTPAVKPGPRSHEKLPVVQADVQRAQDHVRQGRAFLRNGRQGKALVEFNEALQLDPESPAAYANRGRTYFILGKAKQALADLDRAIRLNPRPPGPYLNRARVYAQLGKFDQALADFDRVVRLRPRSFEALTSRGYTHFLKKDYDRALPDLNRALRLNPSFSSAYNNRGLVYLAKGQNDRAVADFTDAIRTNPGFSLPYVNRARTYLKQDKDSQALADLNEVLRRHPRFALGYFFRSKVYAKQGNRARSDADRAEAVRLDPGIGTRKR